MQKAQFTRKTVILIVYLPKIDTYRIFHLKLNNIHFVQAHKKHLL